MAWKEIEKMVFADAIKDLPGALGQIVGSLHLPMIEDERNPLRCLVRDAAHDPRDQPPSGFGAYLIHGDLDIEMAISLSHLNELDGDGHMIFIVTGNLTCPRFVSEWASIVLVGGDLTVTELMFTAREDSSHFVLGDISIWAFIGRDIWIEFEEGRSVSFNYGVGYALRRQRRAQKGGPDVVRPAASEAESLSRLGLKGRDQLNQLDMDLYGEVPSFR